MNERRFVRFQVTPECLVFMGAGTFRVIADPFPDDVRIIGTNYDSQRNVFEVILASETFEPVPMGEIIPVCQGPSITPVLNPLNDNDDQSI